MKLNETQSITETSPSWFRGFVRFLINPHPSIQETGEKRRAQLLASITLILMVGYVLVLLSGPGSSGELIALLFLTAIAYGLSRTRYYAGGTLFFCFTFTAFAYITLFL